MFFCLRTLHQSKTSNSGHPRRCLVCRAPPMRTAARSGGGGARSPTLRPASQIKAHWTYRVNSPRVYPVKSHSTHPKRATLIEADHAQPGNLQPSDASMFPQKRIISPTAAQNDFSFSISRNPRLLNSRHFLPPTRRYYRLVRLAMP